MGSHARRPQVPPTLLPTFWPKPPLLVITCPDSDSCARPPPPPGISLGLVPPVHPVAPHPEPPLHKGLSSLQFLFANAGLAALTVVTAAIIANSPVFNPYREILKRQYQLRTN
jgi:hypothetical protein